MNEEPSNREVVGFLLLVGALGLTGAVTVVQILIWAVTQIL